jgi:murein DD-endopeptidase MepM/ murein hydrolase activator NlpD
MSSFVEPSRSRAVSRLALMAALAAGLAGCGSDFSRMNESPWSSRPQAQAPSNNEVTGSVRQQSAPTHRVESSALPAPGPTYGGGSGIGTYQPPPPPPGRPEYTGSVPPAAPPPRAPAPQQNWSWDGGTAIVVAQGENIDTISRRHGVPVAAIMQANNMTHAAQLQPGQRLVIPRVQHQMGAAQAPMVAPPRTRVAGPAVAPQAGGNTHTVAPGETIYSLARHYRLTPMAIAKANNVGLDHRVKVGDRVVIPGLSGSAPRIAAPAQPPAPPAQPPAQRVAAAKQPQAPAAAAPPPAKQPANPKIVQADPPASARVVSPAADPVADSAPTGTTGSTSASGAPSFRWPVRGRVITGFGPKGNGQQNDGINVAVPEGTPIKAAEEGVVAYAGNELKGYGNLVLVRHSNGFVTAYAHASELSVKKGETVKRGQVLGKAGATGNVTSPQLHFEVRKGATPVDPAQYLQGGG